MHNLNRRIFLIGMMGAGKTYRAQKLSAAFNVPWFDTDVMIEQVAGKTIRDIFEGEGGEQKFRLMEHELLTGYTWPEVCIISCGGGMPCFYGNMEIMKKSGLVVWLNPDLATLAGRLWKETSHRPMVVNSASPEQLQVRLSGLIREREPVFKNADLEITGNPSSTEFMEAILAALD